MVILLTFVLSETQLMRRGDVFFSTKVTGLVRGYGGANAADDLVRGYGGPTVLGHRDNQTAE